MNTIIYNELPVIKSDRFGIRLRPITDQDTHLIVHWRNTSFVREHFIFRQTFTDQMHETWFENKVLTGDVIQYIVELDEAKTPIGCVYYQHFDRTADRAEFGIFLGEERYTHKGIGTECVRIFTDFAFRDLQLHSVCARVLTYNIASRKIFLKNGYHEDGICRDMVKVDGRFEDVAFYSIINGERDGR